jgi:serine phosphatase RsbU (regulator of sigma subunit)
MYARYPADQLVTLVYVLADAARDQLAVGNAGHPPPVLLRGDGTLIQVPFADGPPLGVSRDEPRHRRIVDFRAGDTVVAFTDGLIERRNEDITDGQRRSAEAVRRLIGQDLAVALTQLVLEVRDPSRDDDVAVLAVRRRE